VFCTKCSVVKMNCRLVFLLLISVAYAVDNWCATKNVYLAGYPKSGGDKSKNVELALRKCLALGNDCGGVTKEPQNGDVYTLRKGRTFKDTPKDRKGVWSYTRGACVEGAGTTWCKHSRRYLAKYVREDGKALRYKGLEQAKAVCLKKGDACGGVTKEKVNPDKQYSLRQGSELKKSDTHESSYLVGACTDEPEPTDEPETEEPTEDEVTEAPINPCQGEPCGGSNAGTCYDVDGDYRCDCMSQFEFDGVTCVWSDPCQDPSPCGPNGVCFSAEGDQGHSCDCFDSFELIDGECQFVDPCEQSDCGANGQCVTANGQAMCDCFTGYVEADGTCVDHDECLNNPCNEDRVCVNHEGGHSCECGEGLEEVDGVCSVKGSAVVTIANPIEMNKKKQAGKYVVIKCAVQLENIQLESPKDPNTVDWFRVVEGGDDVKMVHGGPGAQIQCNYLKGTYRLYFKEVTASDAGTYRCQFTHGSVSESAEASFIVE